MKFILIIPFLLLVGCSSYEPTQADRGATAGAVVGGGLGAVIGSQAGNTAGGLALGTITGAGVGALIGHRFQEKDDVIGSQAETINQQQRQIQIHQDEVAELRQATQDQVAFAPETIRPNLLEERDLKASFPEQSIPHRLEPSDSKSNDYLPPSETIQEQARGSLQKVAEVPLETEKIKESIPMLQEEVPIMQPVQATRVEVEKPVIDSWNEQVVSVKPNSPSPGCQEAKKEVASASEASITAEKLYHFRRAERLCPNDLNVHVGLGKVYLQLDRKDDARAEFEKVLKIDPNNQEAIDLMKQL